MRSRVVSVFGDERHVVDTRGSKFRSLFSPAEQARILRGLVPTQGMASG